MAHHVHRPTQLGSWVLINAGWYKPLATHYRPSIYGFRLPSPLPARKVIVDLPR